MSNAWRFVFRGPADEQSLPDLRRRAQASMRENGLAERAVDNAGLLISELTHNAVESASGDGEIQLEVGQNSKGVEIVVECDSNDNLEDLKEALHSSEQLPSPDSERGRGLWLIMQFSRDLEVGRSAAGAVRVSLYLPEEQ